MKLRNHRDMWAGVMFFAFGVTFMILSQQYQMGSAARMGPAYFPTVLGALLALLGFIIFLTAFARSNTEQRLAPVKWRVITVVLSAVALFALLLPRMGMIVSIITPWPHMISLFSMPTG